MLLLTIMQMKKLVTVCIIKHQLHQGGCMQSAHVSVSDIIWKETLMPKTA